MKFEGTFNPPRMGQNQVPIAISGRGAIELRDDALVATGFKTGGNAASGLLALATVLGIVAIGLAGAKLFPNVDGRLLVKVGAGAIIGAIIAFGVRGKRKSSEEALTLEFPWSAVRKVSSVEGGLIIAIKKHKPKGGLYFAPLGESRELVAALNARISG